MTEALQNNIKDQLPWTDRIWKQLNDNNRTISSALFFGKNGLGKSRLALRYAMEILNNDEIFLAGNHPDLHVLLPENKAEHIADLIETEEGNNLPQKTEVKPDDLIAIYGLRYLEKNTNKAKKIISVQQIRLLTNQVVQYPHLAEKKVIIIKDADKMNTNAANALLKTLEEPPINTIFILIASQIEQLPVTIRSRCSEFHFRAPDREIGLQWLQKKGIETHAESYLMMAGRAPLAAIDLSYQNEIENLREVFSSINQLWARKISSLELANEWKKHNFQNIFNHLNQFLNDLLKLKLVKFPIEATKITELFYPVQIEWSKKIASTVQIENLFDTIDEIQSIKSLGEKPVDKQLLLENAAIQIEKLALNQVYKV